MPRCFDVLSLVPEISAPQKSRRPRPCSLRCNFRENRQPLGPSSVEFFGEIHGDFMVISCGFNGDSTGFDGDIICYKGI